jgi:8-oxo-dGTP pyrophosphatase MutT (NUDIX family)
MSYRNPTDEDKQNPLWVRIYEVIRMLDQAGALSSPGAACAVFDAVLDAKPRVGSALIVINGDEDNPGVLLGKRNKEPQRGMWVLPGGKIGAFESIAAAGIREVLEETGLRVDIDPSGSYVAYDVINVPNNEHRIVIYSHATVIGGVLKASTDMTEVRFFTRVELQKPHGVLHGAGLTPLTRLVLGDAGWL